MVRVGMAAVLAGLAVAAAAPAQAPAARFRWQTGQVLTYRVEQNTQAAETVGSDKVETKTKLTLVKRWQVQAVDANGVATLQLSLAALRIETTPPNGEALLFDSAAPDRSSPQLREQMGKYVGAPLAVLRIDPRGRVVEVKESKFGPASRYENEPPFVLTLPEGALQPGQKWERAYKMTLDPPQGAGEKYDAVQFYACKSAAASQATVLLATTVKTLPASIADRLPLLQLQPEGEVIFDTHNGRMQSARLSIDKELKGHQGDDSSYHFQSSYVETLVNP
ncbi:MAG TPA: hypothetical protein VFA26_22480 [Gemmataceae bacterium]|nr:hypothetical protein [Gemmataceae bacterium]